jgi:hypothetical protein
MRHGTLVSANFSQVSANIGLMEKCIPYCPEAHSHLYDGPALRLRVDIGPGLDEQLGGLEMAETDGQHEWCPTLWISGLQTKAYSQILCCVHHPRTNSQILQRTKSL